MPVPKFKVTYIENSGKAHTIEVAEGWSLMEGAVKHLIPGIDADCGGACACATCQVYVVPEFYGAGETIAFVFSAFGVILARCWRR